MIQTKKGALYTGITTDIERRYSEHLAMFNGENNAKGAKYFRSNEPIAVVYREECESRSIASKRESELKKLPRQKKLSLCEQ